MKLDKKYKRNVESCFLFYFYNLYDIVNNKNKAHSYDSYNKEI